MNAFTLEQPMNTAISVMFFDTDAAGVVHNIAYLRFIETARTLLALEYGMDLHERDSDLSGHCAHGD